ncbi:hypothetical protein [Amycolatopsis sulphurea]|uniref:hypothetical protein n=1 Tax=Amycolatopsis sulphurea TaxID=76022 RepID=UPI000BF34B1A|nr:hypothetical protein [Amycolatopsis sulphurea]
MTGTRVLTIEMATAFTELPTDSREPNHPIRRPGYLRTYATAAKRAGKTTMGTEHEVSTPVSTTPALIIEMRAAFTELPTGDTELPTGDRKPGDSEPDDVGSMTSAGRRDTGWMTPAGRNQRGDAGWADNPIHGQGRPRACSGRPPAQVVADDHARVIEMGEKMKRALT